jgi:hypothetical protein
VTELANPTDRELEVVDWLFLEKRNLVDQKRYAVEDVLPARRIGSGIRRERKRMRISGAAFLSACKEGLKNSKSVIAARVPDAAPPPGREVKKSTFDTQKEVGQDRAKSRLPLARLNRFFDSATGRRLRQAPSADQILQNEHVGLDADRKVRSPGIRGG